MSLVNIGHLDVTQLADELTKDVAFDLRDAFVEEHANAPRGGGNLNMHGERRSAPGEVPAPETGFMLDWLAEDPEPILDGWRVNGNYLPLEIGTVKTQARPAIRIVLAKFAGA